MPDALVPVALKAEAAALDAADWATMPDAERGATIPRLHDGYMRRPVLMAWQLGAALRAHRNVRSKRDWRDYLRSIQMERTTARRFLRLHDGYTAAEVVRFTSVKAALDALDKAEPAPVVASQPDDPPAVTPEVVDSDDDPEDDPAAAVESVAREAEPDREAERMDAAERLAIRLQDEDGEAVDVLAGKLDRVEERERDERRGRLKAERERDAMKRALLKGDDAEAARADALAVLGIARKVAA